MADKKKYKYRNMKDAPGYKITKRTKSELMKALYDIMKREQDSQTKTGANYDFIEKLEWNEDWLEPNASDNN